MFIAGKTQCRQTVIIVIVYWGFIKCEAWWISSFRWIIFFYFSNNSTIYMELPCSFYKWRNWGSERQFALGHIKHWSGIWTPVVSTPQSEPLMPRLCCDTRVGCMFWELQLEAPEHRIAVREYRSCWLSNRHFILSKERMKREKSERLGGLSLGKERKQGDKWSKLRIHIRTTTDSV